jgi:hypothetical protein
MFTLSSDVAQDKKLLRKSEELVRSFGCVSLVLGLIDEKDKSHVGSDLLSQICSNSCSILSCSLLSGP